MTSGSNGRTRQQTTLPPKVEAAFVASETRRGGSRTSRRDYASGYEDGYRDALDELKTTILRLNRELLKP